MNRRWVVRQKADERKCMTDNNKTQENITILIYLLYIIFQILDTTQISRLDGWGNLIKIADYLAFSFGCCAIIRRRIKNRWIIIVLSIVFVCIASAVRSGRVIQTANLVLFMFNGINIRSTRILKYYAILASVVVITIIMLERIGIFYTDSRPGTNGRERYYFGFLAATYTANYFLHIVLAYIGQKKRSITAIESGVILGINYLVYKYTITRAVYYLVLIIVALMWIMRACPNSWKGKLTRFIITITMPVLAVIAIILAVEYDPSNGVLNRINEMLTGRLELGKTAVIKYGLTMFGNDITWVTGREGIERVEEYLFVDSAYLNIALTFGLLPLALVIYGFSSLAYRTHQAGKVYICLAIFILAIHSFTDPQLHELKYNPYLLLLFYTYKRDEVLEAEIRLLSN